MPTCFLEKIKDLERGGPGLVAESESAFAKEVFVWHPQDRELLQLLKNMPRGKSFLVIMIGIPGVGKTALLRTLVKNPADLPKQVKEDSLWKAVRQRYNFMEMNSVIPSNRDIERENVWVVPTVDEFYSPSSSDRLIGLLGALPKKVREGDSVILAGNRGMFATRAGEPRHPCDKLRDVVASASKNPDLEPVTFPRWIKEYGGDPTNSSSKESFIEFSKETLKFLVQHVEICRRSENSRECTKKSVCGKFGNLLHRLISMIEENLFSDRLYNLICSMRLRHHDIYLTPRTLLVFWTNVSGNLQRYLSSVDDEGAIFRAIFKSCLISSLYPKSYELRETGIEIDRKLDVDRILLKNYRSALTNSNARRAARLKIYFKGEVPKSREMIYSGAYTDFINEKESSKGIKEAFRYFFVYKDRRFQKRPLDLEHTVKGWDWLRYTFLLEIWAKGKKKEYVTNMSAIEEEFIHKYDYIQVGPVDFQLRRARKVTINLKSDRKPRFDVDFETFLPFLTLSKGFYVDFSLYPSILAKIERVLSESTDSFRLFLLEWLEKNVKKPDKMAYTYVSQEGSFSGG